MFRVLGKRGRGLLFVVAALALAAACSGSSGTATPTGSAANAATNETAATSQSSSGGSGSGLTDAAAKLSNATSYKFKMILSGGDFGQTVALLGAAGVAGDGPFTLSGTVVAKPAKAADVQLTGFHVVEVDGYDYIDTGLGGFVRTPMTDAGWTDSVSPVTMFSSPIITSLADSYQKVGSETKNGVNTDHYQAVSAAFAEQASILGVTGATWSGDVWIATDGGYPVSVAIIAKASDNSVAYQMSFDLTNINDPANSVVPPTNLVGA
jgi:hypothetical protein